MFGHGTFIYDPSEAKAKYGSWDKVAKAVSDLGMSHAWIRAHSKNGLWKTQENKALAAALKARGLTVFAWGWCDGNSVDQDVTNVTATMAEFSPDGYVADIEDGVSGASWTTDRIKDFCSRTRVVVGTKPFIVSSFGFLPYHKPALMKAADPFVDAFAPQVYWFWYPKEAMFNQPGATGRYRTNHAGDYARLCIDVWKHVVRKPLIVTGQAYWGESAGWTQDQAERKLQEFISDFDRFDQIVGLNWWHLAGDKAMSADMAAGIAAAKFGDRLEDRPVVGGPVVVGNGNLGSGAAAYARVDSLNLRTEPGDDPSTIIVAMDIGQPVQVIGDATTPNWKRVSVETGDRMYEGYVFGKYLREPESAEIESLLRHTHEEWFRFQRGRGAEHAQPYAEYIGEMWRALGVPNRDGTDTQYPWSAAFISWVLRKAQYQNFKFSALHAEYIHQAVRRRELSIAGPFWGFRLNEHRPALGDLVCQWRNTLDSQGRPILIDYDYAEDHDDFFSHTDVVVQVNERSVRAIGGNTLQDNYTHNGSVSMKTYRLTSDGYLMDENRVFAVMRNNFREPV